MLIHGAYDFFLTTNDILLSSIISMVLLIIIARQFLRQLLIASSKEEERGALYLLIASMALVTGASYIYATTLFGPWTALRAIAVGILGVAIVIYMFVRELSPGIGRPAATSRRQNGDTLVVLSVSKSAQGTHAFLHLDANRTRARRPWVFQHPEEGSAMCSDRRRGWNPLLARQLNAPSSYRVHGDRRLAAVVESGARAGRRACRNVRGRRPFEAEFEVETTGIRYRRRRRPTLARTLKCRWSRRRRRKKAHLEGARKTKWPIAPCAAPSSLSPKTRRKKSKTAVSGSRSHRCR